MTSLCLALALVLSAGETSPEVVARIGDFTLTRPLFEAYWQALPEAGRKSYEESGGKAAYLQDLIKQKIVSQAAGKLGLLDDPALEAHAELARDQVLYRAVIEHEVTSQIVTEEAMRAYYDEHTERFLLPETVTARQILVTPYGDPKLSNAKHDDAKSEEEARAKIERIHTELENGADFAELARQWSEDVNADKGGLLDDFARGTMVKPLEEAAFSLKPGEFSDAIRSVYGYHILMVVRRNPAGRSPFDAVTREVARSVAEENKDRFSPSFEQLVERLRKEIPVEILDPSLQSREPAGEAPKTP